MRAIDVSSYQPVDIAPLIRTYNAQHVVVKLYLPQENVNQTHSIWQAQVARDAGCTIGGYVFAYQDLDPAQTIRDALALAERVYLNAPLLWLDCEEYGDKPGPNLAWIEAAYAACVKAGAPMGIYTRRGWWEQNIGVAPNLAGLPLWVAQYDGIADLESVALFGGWDHASGKQYSSEGIDQDIFLAEVTG